MVNAEGDSPDSSYSKNDTRSIMNDDSRGRRLPDFDPYQNCPIVKLTQQKSYKLFSFFSNQIKLTQSQTKNVRSEKKIMGGTE